MCFTNTLLKWNYLQANLIDWNVKNLEKQWKGVDKTLPIDPMHGTSAPYVMSSDTIENNTDSKSDDEANPDGAEESHDISSQILEYINSPGSTSALGGIFLSK